MRPARSAAHPSTPTPVGLRALRARPSLTHTAPEPPALPRPRARGKFLFVGDQKFYVRGVTYGTFRPRADGTEVPDPDVVEWDFAQMAANGINAVRTYSVPPRWLLDAAGRRGLRVMVGLPVERFIGFLADKKKAPDVEQLVREGVRACAGHPAVLCYAVGYEIPASVARWFGARRVERYLASSPTSTIPPPSTCGSGFSISRASTCTSSRRTGCGHTSRGSTPSWAIARW